MGVERDVEIALCVFREANDALVVFDPHDRRIVDLNPTTLRLTGSSRKELLASKITDLLSSADPNDLRRLIAAFHQTSFFHAQEGYFLSRKIGGPLEVSVSVSRIHTSPHPLGLAMIHDVSARKKVEAELQQSRQDLEIRVQERTAELAKANRAMRSEIAERLRIEAELRQAKEAAEAAGRVKDRFLAVLSHELRTPLTPILAVASALIDDPSVPPTLRPTLEMIRRNAALEARLIDDLLDVMRAGRGEFPLNRECADLHELIGQAIEVCRSEAEQAGVRLMVDLAAPEHHTLADATRIQQVVWNLLQNAVKCTSPGGTISIRSRSEHDRVIVSVSDDGIGIEPEIMPIIFEPFEQGRSPLRKKIGGLGLGLSIGRSIVEAHGGRLFASSEGAGRGATFTFDLPVAPRPDQPTEPAPARPQSATEAELRPLDLLLVEDNKDVLRYLKLVFEMNGHRVTAATDLASARGALGGRFDVLVSDIELPDGSGLDLMREVRGRVPGIALSGFGAADDVRQSLDAGFAIHLTKPIEANRLESAIRQVASPSPSST
ncbi:ATP-binding protein [Tundrisphaera lichenicola]|uniref:hybrid sensor histidine kinase/response regulator n=1 Tax=Tundrisphaera lichenicola TaxID=2029860 RepID=UPI003EB7508A